RLAAQPRGRSGRRNVMPTNRKLIRRAHRATMNAQMAQELWLGPNRNMGSSFENETHRRETWFRFRDRLMQQWGRHGRRPLAWWIYEAPEKGLRYPGSDYERSILWETPGVLTEQERAELEREWRCEWDRCWEDEQHFFHCAGPDKIYTGDEARVRHLAWAD